MDHTKILNIGCFSSRCNEYYLSRGITISLTYTLMFLLRYTLYCGVPESQCVINTICHNLRKVEVTFAIYPKRTSQVIISTHRNHLYKPNRPSEHLIWNPAYTYAIHTHIKSIQYQSRFRVTYLMYIKPIWAMLVVKQSLICNLTNI